MTKIYTVAITRNGENTEVVYGRNFEPRNVEDYPVQEWFELYASYKRQVVEADVFGVAYVSDGGAMEFYGSITPKTVQMIEDLHNGEKLL